MDTDKSKNDISIEDLLNALNESPEEETTSSGNNIYDFVLAFKLAPGTFVVASTLLYELFRLWNKKEKVSKRLFYNTLSKIFPNEDNSFRRHYLNIDVNELFKHIKDQKAKYNPRAVENQFKNKRVRLNLEKFIEQHGIKAGTLYIEADIFYHIYDTWCFKTRKQTMPYNVFLSAISLFFKYKRLGKEQAKWFGLDESITQHIDVNAVRNWRQGRIRRGRSEQYKVKEENLKNVIYSEEEIEQERDE